MEKKAVKIGFKFRTESLYFGFNLRTESLYLIDPPIPTHHCVLNISSEQTSADLELIVKTVY
jgi:hypothetical protein